MEYQVDLEEKHLNDIFYYLSLNDIIKCRKISKKWKRAVDEYKITSLAVLNEASKFKEKRSYFVTNKNIKYSSTVLETKDSNVFQEKMMKKMLSELKILFVQYGETHDSTFSLDSNINHLKSLEQLNFFHLDTIKGRSLKLPNLKILEIRNYTKVNGLKFQCKDLTDFKTRKELNHFMFTNPKKLINLDVRTLNDNEKRIETLVNLETLKLKEGDSIPDNILKILPKLTKLDIKEISKDKLSGLLKQKKVLRRLKLNIFVGHVNIQTNSDVIDYYPTDDQPSKKGELIVKKFKKLDYYLPWATEINFTDLENYFDSKMPDDIHSRLSGIETITINRSVKSSESFLNFLQNCKKLKKLEIDSGSLEQSTYDELHNICKSLTHLKVNEAKELDLDFILNHKKLEGFKTNQELSFDLFFKLGDELRVLANLEFKLNGKDAHCNLSYYSSKFKLDGDEAHFENRHTMFEFLKIFLLDE